MWKERINRISEFVREKSEVHKAKSLIKASEQSFMVGFREESTEVGDKLGIRGFKGEPTLMMCDLLGRSVYKYSLISVTGFNGDNRMTGNIEVRRRT